MNQSEFESFVKSASYKGEPLEDHLEETHISWIAFSKKHVFKIKKPVKLSFLDFSSLEKRKKYCEKELRLNQRFSKIYLDVLPITKEDNSWCLEKGEGEIKDYAVLMERMISSKRMDKMLRKNKVGMESMQALAKEVAYFHQKAEVIHSTFDLDKARYLFNDISGIEDFIEEELGTDQKKIILRSMVWSDNFLEEHALPIQQRIDQGFLRDLHGDLHGGNIFLYPQPILFDCIEFNDEYRQIDLLYEIAFLCMELEAEGHWELSECFMKHYMQMVPCLETPEDKDLYQYYKCLRANIRAKVLAIGARESKERETQQTQLKAILNYLSMMEKYIKGI